MIYMVVVAGDIIGSRESGGGAKPSRSRPFFLQLFPHVCCQLYFLSLLEFPARLPPPLM